jgi:predicted PurR-regulated permease PerM
MYRAVSFVVLLAVLALVAVLFYMVMAAFILPLFLAVVLVVIFRPMHQWFVAQCQGRRHVAAGLTTITILLIVLLPVALVVYQAVHEGRIMVEHYEASKATGTTFDRAALVERAAQQLGLEMSEEQRAEALHMIDERIAVMRDMLLGGGLRVAVKTLVGAIIMVVALYFFLLDGPAMMDTILHVVPMNERHKEELLARFVSVSRSVVVATLLAAVVQGLLAGIGFYFAGLDLVFLLMSLTMLLAMVPFVGSVSVWLPCALYLYAVQEQTAAAIGLALYGAIVISQVDNFIKPLVLHGQARLHPLLALLSVLGGVQALGPIGILVGPMAVAFLQTLLKMMHDELMQLDTEAPVRPQTTIKSLAPLFGRLRRTVAIAKSR